MGKHELMLLASTGILASADAHQLCWKPDPGMCCSPRCAGPCHIPGKTCTSFHANASLLHDLAFRARPGVITTDSSGHVQELLLRLSWQRRPHLCPSIMHPCHILSDLLSACPGCEQSLMCADVQSRVHTGHVHAAANPLAQEQGSTLNAFWEEGLQVRLTSCFVADVSHRGHSSLPEAAVMASISPDS